MKTIDKDRNSLKRLVEAYGKEDVMKYVNHLDEYMLGGNDWGDDYRRNNPAFIRRIDNSDEIPVNVMEYLWYIGRYGHEFTEILYNGLDIKQSKLRNVRDMSLADVQYWNKVIDPIIGLMSNKTNIKNDDHQITAKDLAQYRNIYMKLESCPCQALQNASRVLMNFVKSIPASSNVNSDRAALESIVSTYGKKDVLNYINHLDEVYHTGDEVPDYSRARNEHDVNTAKYEKALTVAYRCQRQICDSLDNDRQMCYDHAVYAREAIKDILGQLLRTSVIFGKIVEKFSELSYCFVERPAAGQNTDRRYIIKLLTDLRDLLDQGRKFLNA